MNGLHGAFALAGVMKERKYVQENAIILHQGITENLVKVHQNMQSFVSSQDVISVSGEKWLSFILSHVIMHAVLFFMYYYTVCVFVCCAFCVMHSVICLYGMAM